MVWQVSETLLVPVPWGQHQNECRKLWVLDIKLTGERRIDKNGKIVFSEMKWDPFRFPLRSDDIQKDMDFVYGERKEAPYGISFHRVCVQGCCRRTAWRFIVLACGIAISGPWFPTNMQILLSIQEGYSGDVKLLIDKIKKRFLKTGVTLEEEVEFGGLIRRH